ncbi:MAG TPA: hypothetical protein VGA81_10850, partial [Methylomirabilota bacterium]
RRLTLKAPDAFHKDHDLVIDGSDNFDTRYLINDAGGQAGHHILMDARSGYLLEKLPKSEVEDFSLEEVPDRSLPARARRHAGRQQSTPGECGRGRFGETRNAWRRSRLGWPP